MILDYLNFGTFIEIEPNIVEMIIDNGVELDRAKLTIVSAGFAEKFQNAPYAILINRKNAFFYSDRSVDVYNDMENLMGIANLVVDEGEQEEDTSVWYLAGRVRDFLHRDEAVSWLKKTLCQA